MSRVVDRIRQIIQLFYTLCLRFHCLPVFQEDEIWYLPKQFLVPTSLSKPDDCLFSLTVNQGIKYLTSLEDQLAE